MVARDFLAVRVLCQVSLHSRPFTQNLNAEQRSRYCGGSGDVGHEPQSTECVLWVSVFYAEFRH